LEAAITAFQPADGANYIDTGARLVSSGLAALQSQIKTIMEQTPTPTNLHQQTSKTFWRDYRAVAGLLHMYKRPLAFPTISSESKGHKILKSSSSSCRLSREIGRMPYASHTNHTFWHTLSFTKQFPKKREKRLLKCLDVTFSHKKSMSGVDRNGVSLPFFFNKVYLPASCSMVYE
jgi:hypothetical protein